MKPLSTDYKAIYSAWKNFIKGKKKTWAIDQFSYSLETNLLALCGDIHNGSYRHGPYVGHIINEKKRRDIAVATVRDRVVHRLLYDHLIKIWDKTLDLDVYSCRKDKGLHKALHRTQQLLCRHHDSFVWRADVTKFFDSVDPNVLLKIIRRKVNNTDPALWLCEEILRSHNLEEVRSQKSEVRSQKSEVMASPLAISPLKFFPTSTSTNLIVMFATPSNPKPTLGMAMTSFFSLRLNKKLVD